MKSGRSLQSLAQEIERQAQTKRDFIAPTKELAVITSNAPDSKDVALSVGAAGTFEINETAHNQIAEYCKIPRPYYDRIRQEPRLLAQNVNHWFKNGTEKRMVRTLDGKARSLLSDRYRPLDNIDLAEAVLPIIMDHKWSIKSCEITERKLYIKVVSEQITRDIAQDHVNVRTNGRTHIVHPGLVISNSEVGMGKVEITPSVHWEHCLNLAAMDAAGTSRQHVGRKDIRFGDIAAEFFKDETREQDDRAFWMKVRDIVMATMTEDLFEKMVEKFNEARNNAITGDPVKVIELTAKRFALTDNERGSILNHLISGADLSAYGLSAAITRASQDVESYDRATELERLGGQIIELPPQDWQVLAGAAQVQ